MTDSIGQTVDAEVAALKADVAALKAKAVAGEHAFTTWIKSNVPHFISWAGIGLTALKAFGKL